MIRDIKQRKHDHLKLAQDEALKFQVSAGFDRWRFIHNALPEMNLDEVDPSTVFLGKPLQFPFLISSMSGGLEQGATLNATLAAAAEAAGCALAVGSIRPALEDPAARESFLVARQKAPTTVVLANIGLVQVTVEQTRQQVFRLVEELQADGLIIHLNSLQEAFQAEGEPYFKTGLETLSRCLQESPVPIIVKEVGQGLSPDTVRRLEAIGIQTIDIAGAGGTNWISIEAQRLGAERETLRSVAREFADWGEPTADLLEALETQATLIASGGLTRPLDFAKALALGADLGAAASPLLKPGLAGDLAGVSKLLQVWRRTLEMVMFGTGVKTLPEFIGNTKLLTRRNQTSNRLQP